MLSLRLRLRNAALLLGLSILSVTPTMGFTAPPLARPIIGGANVDPSNEIAKSTVAVLSEAQICTGTIIDHDLVLTAAHCVGSNVKIVFSTKATDPNAPSTPVVASRIHEEFNLGRRKNMFDIALLHFSAPLPSGYKVAKIYEHLSGIENEQKLLIAGYGVSNAMLRSGGGQLRSTEIKVKDADFADTEILLSQNQGTGGCYGDSGGPAYVKIGNELYLFGVANRVTTMKCDEDIVYAKVASHTKWIHDTAMTIRRPILASADEQFE